MATSRQTLGTGLPLAIALLLVAGFGCNRQPAGAPNTASASARPPSEALSAGPVVPRSQNGEPENTSRGVLAGMRYLEHMMGGALPNDRVPMIVALHPMDGDPAGLLPLFQRYPRRARLVLPYGHPSGGAYHWYASVREDVAASLVTREADRLAAVLAALVAIRPTVGKPLVTGFSQGGIMAFALAVTHPGALAAAFPISGLLPLSLYPSAALGSRARPMTLPPITAFHGASDLAVPTRSARATIVELRLAGYTADLREYAGVEHDISPEEASDILERIGQAADSLGDTSPAR